MIGDATGLTIPAVFATYEAGVNLASTPGATVTVTVDFLADQRQAWNVIAENRGRNDDNVVNGRRAPGGCRHQRQRLG